jgi:hypothetical protein
VILLHVVKHVFRQSLICFIYDVTLYSLKPLKRIVNNIRLR